MTADAWDGFVGAVVRISLPDGDRRLEPRPPGAAGQFPFDGPVHIITAYNPAGVEAEAAANEASHESLAAALRGHSTFATVGSAPDGSMAEPGFGVLGLPLEDAIVFGRRFGQAAVYRWTEEALTIVGVDDPRHVEMGWALVRLAGR